MLSFWEKESFLDYDLLIIGGGIVGLSTACSWKERHPKSSVLILESGVFPSGASTRNAGFACYGSAAEILHDIKQIGESRALEMVEMRAKGLLLLRNRLGDNAIGYEEFGGGELILQSEDFDTTAIPYLNGLLHPIFGQEVFVHDNSALVGFGFQREHIRDFIGNRVEGQIHTGLMMKNLIACARSLGVEILTGAKALKPELINGKWRTALEGNKLEFNSERVAVCTNAFTESLFPGLDIKPGRGQVLITAPIPGLKLMGIFHFDEGYYYFRNVGERVLFGGGRNLAFEEETTLELELNPAIQNALETHLKNMILPSQTHFSIEHRWAGIMAFGEEKVPILQSLGNGLVLGVRMNGMGVAIGSEIGKKLCDIMS